jgi:hypothetical protein
MAFLKGVLRLALAILLVVMVIAGVSWGIYSWQSYQDNQRNAELETPRTWPKLKIEGLDAGELSLKTMWRNSDLHYRFEIKNIEEMKRKRDWTIVLYDLHGFEVLRHKLTEIIDTVNKNSDVIGVQATGNTYMGPDDYRRAQKWSVIWVDR